MVQWHSADAPQGRRNTTWYRRRGKEPGFWNHAPTLVNVAITWSGDGWSCAATEKSLAIVQPGNNHDDSIAIIDILYRLSRTKHRVLLSEISAARLCRKAICRKAGAALSPKSVLGSLLIGPLRTPGESLCHILPSWSPRDSPHFLQRQYTSG